jgi:vacuolar iron transporter family protein
VSVQSQADSEAVALAQEKDELREDYAGERRELTDIYVRRGLDLTLAKQVSQQLMDHDALGAHARDELGLTAHSIARPLQAAFSSAASFTAGSAVPLLVVTFSAPRYLFGATVVASLLCLLVLGGVAAKVSGARVVDGALRVALWSALAMGVTAGAGALLGTAL